MRRVGTVFALFALTVAPAIKAQEAGDTLPFRAHQWGFLFAGGSSFVGLGGLHFTAPNRATLLNIVLDVSHSHQSFSPVPDTTITGTNTTFSLTARIGRRFYQAVRHDVAAYQTIGFSGGGLRSCGSPGFGGSACFTQGSAGLFGEVGAQYFLTSRLSIGGQVNASLTATYSHGSGVGTTDSWSIALNGGGVSFGGGIYF